MLCIKIFSNILWLVFFDPIDLCMGINALHMFLLSYKLLSVFERFVNSILSLYKIAYEM